MGRSQDERADEDELDEEDSVGDAGGPDDHERDPHGEADFAPTDNCPYCDEEIYDQAERCPHCGRYISIEDAPRHLPLWLVIGAILCVVLAVLWCLR